MDQQFIDELLERYLGLLDEYTTLRQSLSQAQTGMYQNIARANFSGERGMRYGQDQYDERMQAARRLAIEVDDKQQPTFTIIDSSAEEAEVEVVKTAEETKGGEEQVKADDIEETKESSSKKAKKNKNPLHWFGLFAPMPLRTAQTQSVEAVEQIIPRLVTVNAEMLNLEIEVRRARKRRVKAEAAAEKKAEAEAEAEALSTVTKTGTQTASVQAS